MPDFLVFPLVSDDMIVKSELPDFPSVLILFFVCIFCRNRFNRANNIADRRARALLLPLYQDDQMNMVWHNYIFADLNAGITVCGSLYFVLDNSSDMG